MLTSLKIVVPLLRTPQEARELVQSAKFPPLGRRGFGSPIAPERFNPVPSFTEYLQQANDALLTIVQIETKEALESVEEIAAVEGIDALLIGPFDLGELNHLVEVLIKVLTRLGNNIGHPIINGVMADELKSALSKVLAASKKAGKKCGIYCTGGEQAKIFADQGFDMLNVFTDYGGIDFAAKEQLSIATAESKPSRGGSY